MLNRPWDRLWILLQICMVINVRVSRAQSKLITDNGIHRIVLFTYEAGM